jgi:precorrin-3B C17-methyltransferase
MKMALIALTLTGASLAEKMMNSLSDVETSAYLHNRHEMPGFQPFESIFDLTERLWPQTEAFVFICASGIAVRAVGPLAENKLYDPAVIACDESGRFAISLLSGHAGGANTLAKKIADSIGATPVITTASDSQTELGGESPKNLTLGIGCRRGVSALAIERSASILLWDAGLPMSRICEIATIDLKKDEEGLLEFARIRGLPIHFFSAFELSRAEGDFSFSQKVYEVTGTGNVCERAAALSCPKGAALLKKSAKDGVCVAVYEKAPAETPRGKLIVAGFGPGGRSGMTTACINAFASSDVIVGYSGYISLVKPLFPNKEYLESPMTKERERCAYAIRMASGGKAVCVASSGDSGVYGMASLVLELCEQEENISFDISIIPGITAALSGAALLGAPLGHDFAVISLSDLLTDWDLIEKRLEAAAIGDFAIVIYNPGSKSRKSHLRRACETLIKTLPQTRLCGIASSIDRDGECRRILTLKELSQYEASMNDTIFIGNSRTHLAMGLLATPRGYL